MFLARLVSPLVSRAAYGPARISARGLHGEPRGAVTTCAGLRIGDSERTEIRANEFLNKNQEIRPLGSGGDIYIYIYI